ncbi:hypothetical protein BpHYR1_034535, partial [Brachionus plicatilis]
MNMYSDSFVIVSWTESKKNEFSIIRIEDVFLDDEEETVSVEQSYQFKIKKKVYDGIVKFIGSKQSCEKKLKDINRSKKSSLSSNS